MILSKEVLALFDRALTLGERAVAAYAVRCDAERVKADHMREKVELQRDLIAANATEACERNSLLNSVLVALPAFAKGFKDGSED